MHLKYEIMQVLFNKEHLNNFKKTLSWIKSAGLLAVF
jgi:hypothetical protein